MAIILLYLEVSESIVEARAKKLPSHDFCIHKANKYVIFAQEVVGFLLFYFFLQLNRTEVKTH